MLVLCSKRSAPQDQTCRLACQHRCDHDHRHRQPASGALVVEAPLYLASPSGTPTNPVSATLPWCPCCHCCCCCRCCCCSCGSCCRRHQALLSPSLHCQLWYCHALSQLLEQRHRRQMSANQEQLPSLRCDVARAVLRWRLSTRFQASFQPKHHILVVGKHKAYRRQLSESIERH